MLERFKESLADMLISAKDWSVRHPNLAYRAPMIASSAAVVFGMLASQDMVSFTQYFSPTVDKPDWWPESFALFPQEQTPPPQQNPPPPPPQDIPPPPPTEKVREILIRTGDISTIGAYGTVSLALGNYFAFAKKRLGKALEPAAFAVAYSLGHMLEMIQQYTPDRVTDGQDLLFVAAGAAAGATALKGLRMVYGKLANYNAETTISPRSRSAAV